MGSSTCHVVTALANVFFFIPIRKEDQKEKRSLSLSHCSSPHHDTFRKDLDHLDIPQNIALIPCIEEIILTEENEQEVTTTWKPW